MFLISETKLPLEMDLQPQQQDNEQQQEIAESADNNDDIKSITNIYYDCLEIIFDFLDLEDLLNVALTCKRLQTAAAAKFGEICGDQNVYILPMEYGPNDARICMEENGIQVFTLRFCLPFLRCFGAKIVNLFAYYHEAKDNANMNHHISQYCAKTLKSISLMGIPEILANTFTMPFERVENVSAAHTDFGRSLRYLGHLFPNVRDLELIFMSVDEDLTADIRFAHLENLSVMIDDVDFSLKSLMYILHANPQLQYLQLNSTNYEGLTFDDILTTIGRNPSLTKLKITNGFGPKTINTNQNDLMRFASEHPGTIELAIPRYLITPENAVIFINQLNQLKIFRFLINGLSNYDRLVSQLDSEWKCEHEHEDFDGANQHQTVTLKR